MSGKTVGQVLEDIGELMKSIADTHGTGRGKPNVVVLRPADPSGQFWPLTVRSLLGLPPEPHGWMAELSCGYERGLL